MRNRWNKELYGEIGHFNNQRQNEQTHHVWRVLFMCRITLLFIPHSKSLTKPPFPIQCCCMYSIYAAKSSWNHDTTLFLEGGGGGLGGGEQVNLTRAKEIIWKVRGLKTSMCQQFCRRLLVHMSILVYIYYYFYNSTNQFIGLPSPGLLSCRVRFPSFIPELFFVKKCRKPTRAAWWA